MTKLTTKEMLIALAEGKKIRAVYWGPEDYVCLDDNIFKDNNGKIFVPSLSSEWGLYEDPVKPVRRFLYDYVDLNGSIKRSSNYYATDDEFLKFYPNVIKFQKRENDWTEL